MANVAGESNSRDEPTRPAGPRRFGPEERRAARRYDLSLPIVVRATPPEQFEPLHGTTRNISARGIYFVVERDFASGSILEFTFTVPAEITQGTEVFIRAQSRVLRSERTMREDDTIGTGVAVVIERFAIIQAKSGSS